MIQLVEGTDVDKETSRMRRWDEDEGDINMKTIIATQNRASAQAHHETEDPFISDT